MKEHESRKVNVGEVIKWADGDKRRVDKKFDEICYVDTNNFLHNLSGPGIIWYNKGKIISEYFFIHGEYLKKEKWLIEREKLLLELHREIIL